MIWGTPRFSRNWRRAGTGVGVLLTLLIGAAEPVAAQEGGFGRLFTTPSERAIIDRSRQRTGNTERSVAKAAATPEVVAAKPDTPPAPPPAQAPVRFDGYVSRGNAPIAVWSQGSQNESKLVADVDKSGHTVFRVGSRSSGIAIKPGQVLFPNEQLTKESYLTPTPEPVLPVAKTPAREIEPVPGN